MREIQVAVIFVLRLSHVFGIINIRFFSAGDTPKMSKVLQDDQQKLASSVQIHENQISSFNRRLEKKLKKIRKLVSFQNSLIQTRFLFV